METIKVNLRFFAALYAVEPVPSGAVLSGYPVFSSQLSKFRIVFRLSTSVFTSIKRSLLFSGRGHP